MKKGLLYIFSFFKIQTFSQAPPDIKKLTYDRWKQTCAALQVKADTFFYSNRVDSSAIDCALVSLSETSVYKKVSDYANMELTDSIAFSQSELAYIKKELKKQTTKVWPENLYEKSHRVQQPDIEKIISSIDKQNLSLEQKLCKAIYTFSEPITLRKGTVSIIYIEIDNVMKTEGGIWVYLKHGNEWIMFSPLCYQNPVNSYRK